ncbi:amidohydrolase [Halopolyspora algeriensis]|nr:amidohydrolase [Halopolyspora algeriensis]
MDSVRSFTDAVAVRNGRIIALGSATVEGIVTSQTEVVDLRGRLLLPGFQDAHVHPVYGGLQRLRCDLSASTDARDCLRRVGEYARTHPEAGWLLGAGWDLGHFPAGAPARESLDTVTGDRPAYLVNQDHHGAWVNTAALRHAGIDRDTPDPPNGRIERDAVGHPAGVLHEGATELVTRVIPAAAEDEYRQGLLEGQRYLHTCGVTAWQDAIIGPYLGYADTLDLYRDLDRQGLLTARCTGALWWDPTRDESQLADLLSRRARARGGSHFRAETVKIMQDGICENHTAAMLEPYLGGHGSGESRVDAEVLARAVRRLDDEGFQVHFHAIGDRAVREALDAVAGARQVNGMNDLRHQIAHVQVVHPDDLARFRTSGVAANIQARWAINDLQMTELTTPYLGRARASRQYPFRTMHQAGAVLAAGSDWPISGAEPLQAVHVAVNRSEHGTDQEPFLPQQALDLGDALAVATIGSAWVNHLDDETGSIELGKRADLAVLDADPFLLPPTEIGSVSVDMTVVDGNVVHECAR